MHLHIIKKRSSPFFIFPFILLLTLLFAMPWVSAIKLHIPKPKAWQIDGIVAALDDGHDGVKSLALNQLSQYRMQDLTTVVKKPEDIARKILSILKDKSVEASVRAGAASVLGNLGDIAKPYAKDMADILKDKSVEASVRAGAASVLGNLGDAAKPYTKDVADILKDKSVESSIRLGAASALANLGDTAKPYVKDIVDILKDKSVDFHAGFGLILALANLEEPVKPYVKDIINFLKYKKTESNIITITDYSESDNYSASEFSPLANLGDAAKPYLKDIADILKDKTVDAEVRSRAALVFPYFGQATQPYIKDIINFVQDKSVDYSVRSSAADALIKLRDSIKPYVKDIADIVKDKSIDSTIRSSAVSILGNLGDVAKPYVKDITDIVKDKSVDNSLRSIAADTLSNLGDIAKPYAKDITKIYAKEIADILKDKSVNLLSRSSAASTLSDLGEAAQPYVKDILDFILDEVKDITEAYYENDEKSIAAYALGNLGKIAQPYAKDIIKILSDKSVDTSLRSAIARALGKIEQLDFDSVVVILDNVYYAGESEFEQWRFLTYLLGAGTEDVIKLLKWLGRPQAIPDQLNHDEGVKTLEVFRKIWEPSKELVRFREDLARQIAVVARKVSWQPQDIVILETHYNNLKNAGYNEADSLQSVIVNLKTWQWFFNARTTILIHAAFWLALIFAYPKFPQVQAIFFWNPWVRRILGIGYVGLILTWVPFFREKLFEPFKPSLLADAGLDNFNPEAYFPNSKVKVPGVDEPVPITQVLPNIKGQVILEGDSGLGKSMYLRYLVKTSGRLVVYLPARKCDKGVIEAIQAKLHGQAQDADFLKNLIYSGALDICIDGLNEVTADTRAKICQFAESYFRGNIIMTTQPLEWTPPSTAKIYKLLPLEEPQIQQFLISRQPRLPKNAKVQGTDYEQATASFLTKALSNQQSPQELSAIEKVLSNPMDLTVVALMLSQGEYPDLFHLQQHQYQLMAAEYLQEWNQEFPLKKFSDAVYQMRLKDEQALPADEFYQVLQSLEDDKYKMVVSRQWQDEKGEAKREWYFRHDKIMDFFLVQNFLGESEEAKNRLLDHMDDPRFRGVYFLLATLLPLDAAKELKEKLVQYAADTKDHTVSDTFVQLLRPRS
ncbi:HEAT repeat domain-containing protein [Nostoc sp. UIC 10890]